MKIENCWKLKLLKFLQVLLTVSVITFFDVIFRFAVYCFTNIMSSVRISLSEKSKDNNLKESTVKQLTVKLKADGEIKSVVFYFTSFKLAIHL